MDPKKLRLIPPLERTVASPLVRKDEAILRNRGEIRFTLYEGPDNE